MKRELYILGAVLLTANIYGQVEQTMSYQAEIRSSNNDLLASSPGGMRESKLQGSETGSPVYVEPFTFATDEDGIVSIDLVSDQAVTGIFSDVDWFTKTLYSKTETDQSGTINSSALLDSISLTSELSALVTIHYVGEFYGGGIVFEVDDEGKHGLIATTIDKSIRKQQLNKTNILTNTVIDGLTIGKYYTDTINAMKGAGTDDAQVVENYQDANLGEWYLPTRYDLIQLYLNRAVIGGYTDFAKGWKSTEVSRVNEWYKSFITGGEFSNGKDDAVYIRVIREF